MTEYSGEKKKYEDKISIMHFNDKTGEYKVLSMNPLLTDKEGNQLDDNRKGAFIGIRIGKKGEQAQKLTLALSKQEIAFLIMEATKMYNKDL